MPELKTNWQRPLQAANCTYCDWSYLLTPSTGMPICPHCYLVPLTPLAEDDLDQTSGPELVVPFAGSDGRIQEQLNKFAKSFRFTPQDLQTGNMATRLRRVYVPTYLVDSDVTAVWQAEVGFDYQVVSHQESFKAGGWRSKEVQETRIRWEARAGQLQRRYDNVPAPALEEIDAVQTKLGSYENEQALPYQQEMLEEALVRLPNRDHLDAWPDTHPRFQQLASLECQEAAEAGHIRHYKWQARYDHQHWSLLLLPLYSTYYLDDDQQPIPVLLHGRTGQLSGLKRASMKRAKKITAVAAILAGLLFLLTLALIWLEPSLTCVTAPLTFLLGLGAIFPIAYVSQFNRNQEADFPMANPQENAENPR